MDVTSAHSKIRNDKQLLSTKLLDTYSPSPSPRITVSELAYNMHSIYDALLAVVFSDTPKAFSSLSTTKPTTALEDPEPLKEYDLIHRLSEPQNGWSNISTVALFEKHFMARFCLYFIAKYSTLLTLDIQLVAIHVELTSASTHTTHTTHVGHVASPALEGFYFDWSQFNNVTPETVNNLLTDFWTRYTYNLTAIQDLALLNITTPLNALTLQNIKQAYRLKAQKHHPDKGGNSETFYAIEQAYQRLKSLIFK